MQVGASRVKTRGGTEKAGTTIDAFAAPVVFYDTDNPQMSFSTKHLNLRNYENITANCSMSGESGSVYFIRKGNTLEPVGLHRGKACIPIERHNIALMAEHYHTAWQEYQGSQEKKNLGWLSMQVTPLFNIVERIKSRPEFVEFLNKFRLSPNRVQIRMATRRDQYYQKHTRKVFEKYYRML